MIIVWTIVALLTFCIGFVVGVRVCRNAYEKKQMLNMLDATLKTINETIGKPSVSTYKDSKTKKPFHIDLQCLRCKRLIGAEPYAIVDKVNEIHKTICQHCISKESFKCVGFYEVKKEDSK